MITVLDLNHIPCKIPLISENVISSINTTLASQKRVLIFLNSRWQSKAIFCKDCGNIEKCEDCDISYSVQRYPFSSLICYQCGNTKELLNTCTKCNWTNLIWIGTGTQKVEENIQKLFKNNVIIRLDSDKIKKEWVNVSDIQNSDIIIATESINTVTFDNLWLVVFLLFENELIIPEYNIEEKIYANILINAKKWADVIIQTYCPQNELLKIITEGNYNDFLKYTLNERKSYNYPPFSDFAEILVSSNSKDRILDIMAKIYNKLEILNIDSNFQISYNKDIFNKKKWLFFQKILLKWKDLEGFLKNIKWEIIRNREVVIEWK